MSTVKNNIKAIAQNFILSQYRGIWYDGEEYNYYTANTNLLHC